MIGRNKVIWLTGLSGSGKTTIAETILKLSREGNISIPVTLIDGDVIRDLNRNFNFEKEGRMANVKTAIELCKENEDRLVIVSLISPLREMRDLARKELGDRFFEVYVQCSLQECIRRDVKGLYKKALNGEIKNFTGIHQVYEEPIDPEYVINTEYFKIEMCVSAILYRAFTTRKEQF